MLFHGDCNRLMSGQLMGVSAHTKSQCIPVLSFYYSALNDKRFPALLENKSIQ